MTSLRNIDESTMADRLLSAARESILLVGWKRTTLTDIATRAGVSRMTVYRTYADMTELLADLMMREQAALVAEAVDSVEESRAWPDRLAIGVARTVAQLRENDLFRRMIDVDPEWVLPYLLERRGRFQDAVLDVIGDRIAQGQRDSGIRTGDPVVLARTVLLTAHGFAISAPIMTDSSVGQAVLDQELTELLRRYLTP
ncbi:MAG: TetR/AcrR family transcriptional regulator [Nocardioides sp.]|nr:TetR/AcrR family transcriptional regulator [Nocardioides sp.]